MKIGIDNYSNKEKNKWRYKIWREASKRVSNPKKATILYLAAEQDLDRRQAIKSGFSASNMIAVDLRPQVVDQLRSKNKLAVLGDIKDVAYFWGKPDVLLFDFCNGLTEDNVFKLHNLIHAGKLAKGTVIVANFLKGREQKKAFADITTITPVMRHFPEWTHKHRAAIFMASMALRNIAGARIRGDIVSGSESELNFFINFIADFRPAYFTYKSPKNQYFDSVVLTTYFEPQNFSFGDCSLNPCEAQNQITDYALSMAKLRQQISAVKAVQTMRKNGKLAPCSNF